jgi:hypothetical protein
MLNRLAALIPNVLTIVFAFLGVVAFVWLLGYGLGFVLSMLTIGVW